VELESDLLVCGRFLIRTDQKKGAVIMKYGLSDREIIFYSRNDLFRDRNQPVFRKFGLFNVKSAVIAAVVVTH
jgi:hypothetical protein